MKIKVVKKLFIGPTLVKILQECWRYRIRTDAMGVITPYLVNYNRLYFSRISVSKGNIQNLQSGLTCA
jgi:hypothetical protein